MNLTSDSIAQTATRLPLPSGETHADITGPPTGPTLIMVPGATLPMAVWLPLSEPLNLRGIRTVRYDLPGRGHTPLSRHDRFLHPGGAGRRGNDVYRAGETTEQQAHRPRAVPADWQKVAVEAGATVFGSGGYPDASKVLAGVLSPGPWFFQVRFSNRTNLSVAQRRAGLYSLRKKRNRDTRGLGRQ